MLQAAIDRRRPTDGNPRSSRRELRGQHCRCSACGLEFNSLSAFDAHRTGEWNARRCLDLDSMIARGMRLNRGGWWIARMRIPRGLSFAGAAIAPGVLLSPGGGVARPPRARREFADELAP